MAEVKHINDPEHGLVTVVKGNGGMTMTNAKPDTEGRWVEYGDNQFRYELYPNRAARRKKLRGNEQRRKLL